jgi:hypothetical protein
MLWNLLKILMIVKEREVTTAQVTSFCCEDFVLCEVSSRNLE